jgi:hypothetical protein
VNGSEVGSFGLVLYLKNRQGFGFICGNISICFLLESTSTLFSLIAPEVALLLSKELVCYPRCKANLHLRPAKFLGKFISMRFSHSDNAGGQSGTACCQTNLSCSGAWEKPFQNDEFKRSSTGVAERLAH